MKAIIAAVQPKLQDCTSQELANLAWACVQRTDFFDEALFAKIAKTVKTGFVQGDKKITDVKAQELTNLASSFATRQGFLDGAAQQPGHGKDVSDSSINLPGDKRLFFSYLAEAALPILDYFTPQGIANLAEAFAKMNHVTDAEFFPAVRKHLLTPQGQEQTWKPLDDFAPLDYAIFVRAFAKLGQLDDAMLHELAKQVDWHLDTFPAQSLSNVVWAFAKSGHLDAPLFEKLGKRAKLQLAKHTVAVGTTSTSSTWNPQDLANAAYGFAKACHTEDAELWELIARHAVLRIHEFNAQDLTNTAWALAKVGHPHPEFFETVADQITRKKPEKSAVSTTASTLIPPTTASLVSSLTPPQISNLTWAFCEVRKQEKQTSATSSCSKIKSTESIKLKLYKQVFSALADATMQKVENCTPSELANLAWQFANSNYLDKNLFETLAKPVAKYATEFGEDDLKNVEWAFAQIANSRKCADVVALFRKKAGKSGLAGGQDDADGGGSRVGSGATAEDDHDILGKKSCTKSAAAAQLSPSEISARLQELFNTPAAREKYKSNKGPHILVAGGGIGGAALAVALQTYGLGNVTVLETDKSFSSRKQGYGLTIQRQDMLQVMNINLQKDDAPSTSHYSFDSAGNILGFYGEAFSGSAQQQQQQFLSQEQQGGNGCSDGKRFVHIPRQQLRQRILEQVQPGVIRWGSKLQSFEVVAAGENLHDGSGSASSTSERTSKKSSNSPLASNRPAPGTVSVTLTDQTVLTADLLVGADGIFSTVRKQMKLRNDRLNYCGLVVVLGIVHKPCKLAERRIFETMDGTTRIYAMPFTTSSTMWQLSFPSSEEDAKKWSKDPALLKKEILRRCLHWHQPVPQLLAQTELENMAGYPVYDRDQLQPEVLRAAATSTVDPKKGSESLSPVTLMGDAAHPMTPFRAQGANQALSDAALLAETLAESILRESRSSSPSVLAGAGATSLCTTAPGKDGGHDVSTSSPASQITAGLLKALLVFERKMLNRSGRIVELSREKAKALHSPLALQVGRKVQRQNKTGIDMQQAIRALRKKKIGAHSCEGTEKNLDQILLDTIDEDRRRGGATSSTSAVPEKKKKDLKRGASAKTKTATVAGKQQKEASRGESVGKDVTNQPARKRRKVLEDPAEVTPSAGGAASTKTATVNVEATRTSSTGSSEESKNAIPSAELVAPSGGSASKTRLWGYCQQEENWKKCDHLGKVIEKNGEERVRVLWKHSNSVAILSGDCVRLRGKFDKVD
ncbi:unnamed protein product, partial [Amoebophrya sp. A120]|eukprot:GSA120T00007933001.1